MNAAANRPCRPPDDGVLRYVYDAWNRLVKAQRYADGDTTTIGEYRYLPLTRRSPRSGGHRAAMGKARLPRRVKGLPDNRRASKVVSHAGVEAVAGDGGNATVHYYYSSRWQILEARNGSNQATRQWVWGTQYVDEPLLMDVTLDVASAAERPRARDARRATPGTPRQGRAFEPGGSNTCDPDVTDATSIKDRRYYYQQDRQPLTRERPRCGPGRCATAERSSGPRVKGNWNVVALLEADDTQGTAGRCVERYAYSPYGEFLVLKGEGASGNLGSALVASTVGNPFTHQGLPFDQEKGSYQNRSRDLHASIQRFAQRDPLGGGSHARGASYDGPSLFLDRRANPVKWRDWDGRCVKDDVRSKGFFRECCRTSGHQGTQFCTDCEVCLCGDDYVNIANEWRDTKDPVCGACTYDTYPPYPTCGKAAKSAPQVCCNFYNQPTEEDCKDCCLIIQGEGKDPPPYWEVFVGMCMNACSVYHPK